MPEELQQVVVNLLNWVVNTGLKIIISLIIMFIAFKVINFICKKVEKISENKNTDKTIIRTLAYILKIALKCVVIVCLVGYLGIDTSSLTALIASAGVCIGLAVNGALSNLAGGVLLLVTRPFKVDDFIEAQGVSGTVTDIHMTNTKIVTPDNKVIYLPNGALSSGNIINYSEKDTRRVDFSFSIAYNADSAKAMSIIQEILNNHQLVLKEPATFVRMSAHGNSKIEITARAWVNSADYWTVNFDIIESVKAKFDEIGISIPHEQLDVHLKNA